MSRDYHVRLNGTDNDIVTGTPNTKQTLQFTNLTTIDSVGVPTTFESAPAVNPLRGTLDVDFNVNGISKTAFNIYRSASFPAGTTQWDANLIITGTPAVTGAGFSLLQSLDMISWYLNDRKGNTAPMTFDEPFKAMLLQQGQELFMELVDANMINNLWESETSLTLDSDGKLNLVSGLANDIWDLERGVQTLKITGHIYDARLIPHLAYIQGIHTGVNRTDKEVVFYTIGNNIYLDPFDSGDTVDIVYLRLPQVINFDLTNEANHVGCEFGRKEHNIILGLALRDYIDITPQARRLYENALITMEKFRHKRTSDDSKRGTGRGLATSFSTKSAGRYSIYTD